MIPNWLSVSRGKQQREQDFAEELENYLAHRVCADHGGPFRRDGLRIQCLGMRCGCRDPDAFCLQCFFAIHSRVLGERAYTRASFWDLLIAFAFLLVAAALTLATGGKLSAQGNHTD